MHTLHDLTARDDGGSEFNRQRTSPTSKLGRKLIEAKKDSLSHSPTGLSAVAYLVLPSSRAGRYQECARYLRLPRVSQQAFYSLQVALYEHLAIVWCGAVR